MPRLPIQCTECSARDNVNATDRSWELKGSSSQHELRLNVRAVPHSGQLARACPPGRVHGAAPVLALQFVQEQVLAPSSAPELGLEPQLPKSLGLLPRSRLPRHLAAQAQQLPCGCSGIWQGANAATRQPPGAGTSLRVKPALLFLQIAGRACLGSSPPGIMFGRPACPVSPRFSRQRPTATRTSGGFPHPASSRVSHDASQLGA